MDEEILKNQLAILDALKILVMDDGTGMTNNRVHICHNLQSRIDRTLVLLKEKVLF